jgi:DNA invertase Pin-like site-specific DNA recombinase
LEYKDDGITGVHMDNRPDFQRMLEAIEAGEISAVFIKDKSRLGRNLLEVGHLEETFVDMDIRLVCVGEGIDTALGEDELGPIRNWYNEYYSRDISRKRRMNNFAKGHAGEPLGLPPYGYIKDPKNPKFWIVDKPAADVVKRIFSMSLDGMGIHQIAVALTEEKVLNPVHYWQSIGVNRSGKKGSDAHFWGKTTVQKILERREYLGDVINFKTYSKSFKNKKRIENAPENMAIFEGVHEAIIDRADFEKIQQKRGTTRKRATFEGEKSLFSGFLVCGDCGHNMHFHFNQGNHSITFFNCSNYKGNRGTCEKTHYIRCDFLEQAVLGEVKRLTKFATKYEGDFVQSAMGFSLQKSQGDKVAKEKELASLSARDKELDKLFERIYEDNLNGKLTDERYHRMAERYTAEQTEIADKLKALRSELEKFAVSAMTTEHFTSLVRKYTRAKKLTPRLLSELIERIEVFHAEKIDGKQVQRLIIHWHCIGAVDIPDLPNLTEPTVEIQTRKGVSVTYSAAA